MGWPESHSNTTTIMATEDIKFTSIPLQSTDANHDAAKDDHIAEVNPIQQERGACFACCYTEKCPRQAFKFFLFLLVCGIILGTVTYFMNMVPYQETLTFTPANCTVDKANYTGELIKCSCGSNAKSRCM